MTVTAMTAANCKVFTTIVNTYSDRYDDAVYCCGQYEYYSRNCDDFADCRLGQCGNGPQELPTPP